MNKKYTQQELETFVRCWQTSANLEGLCESLMENCNHRTTCHVERSRQYTKNWSEERRQQIEEEGYKPVTWYNGDLRFHEKTVEVDLSPDWAKRRANVLRAKGVKLKDLHRRNHRTISVDYGALSVIASQYC